MFSLSANIDVNKNTRQEGEKAKPQESIKKFLHVLQMVGIKRLS